MTTGYACVNVVLVYKTHPRDWRKNVEKPLIACIRRTPKVGKKVLRKS